MAAPTRRRPIPLCAGAFFALLAFGLAAPSQARAGCSHYVLARSASLDVSAPASLDLLLIPPAAPVAPPSGPSPCAGLSCSSDPLPPPPPAPVPVRIGEWACLGAQVPPARPEPFAALADLGPIHPIHRGPSVDRPPRPAGRRLSSLGS